MKPAPGAPREREFSVKSLADYLRGKFGSDDLLRTARVRGEVSNRAVSARGHVNFVLKEGDAVLSCFAWEDDFLRFPEFANGAAVVVSGGITTYPQRSTYQMIARRLELDGVGDVHRLFEERKKRLAAEGLFAPERKRVIPQFPFRVALVSSRRADGAIDFETRLCLRRPHVRIVWCEASVQGPSAPYEIAGALARAGSLDVDAVVVTRGGGSFEDLFAFSDEQVVRAIARCPHPVISAVGHTVNQQLSDFAADLHAETPSAAAECIGLETRELLRRVEDAQRRARSVAEHRFERWNGRLERALMRSKLHDSALFFVPARQRVEALEERAVAALRAGFERRRDRLGDAAARLARQDPSRRLADRGLRLQAAALGLDRTIANRVAHLQQRRATWEARLEPATVRLHERDGARLSLLRARLEGKNPEAILERGYAIVTCGGAIVREPADVPVGAIVEARVARGTLSARVESRSAHGNDGVG